MQGQKYACMSIDLLPGGGEKGDANSGHVLTFFSWRRGFSGDSVRLTLAHPASERYRAPVSVVPSKERRSKCFPVRITQAVFLKRL